MHKLPHTISLFFNLRPLIFFLFTLTGFVIYPVMSMSQEVEPYKTVIRDAKKTSKDTTDFKKHSAHRASIYSMVLPGAGQAYNKKYWKIPVIYAGFGVFIYFINYNHKEYKKFGDAYSHSILNDSTLPVNDYEEKYTSEQLLSAKNDFRRNRDLSYILASVWYLLNIVDAAVDAHLFTWEVDDNLSMKIEPAFYNRNRSYISGGGGVKLTIRF